MGIGFAGLCPTPRKGLSPLTRVHRNLRFLCRYGKSVPLSPYQTCFENPCTRIKRLSSNGMKQFLHNQLPKPELSSGFLFLEDIGPATNPPTREARYGPFFPANRGAGACSVPRRGSLPGCGQSPAYSNQRNKNFSLVFYTY